mmetsp:Transcript_1877/g.2951  ORF Transcript_1877/g.2951 Transcript_1877/m.2951 type:complete len:82 (-) Transcript_1877:823-1068(-)
MELARRTFVTGQPGCGKTTLVMAIARALIDAGVRCRGFYTEECLQVSHRFTPQRYPKFYSVEMYDFYTGRKKNRIRCSHHS